MDKEESNRGFRTISAEVYPPGAVASVVSESSAIGDYEDSFDNPGSSFLWVGKQHHLNREEVTVLRDALTHWLENKRLPK